MSFNISICSLSMDILQIKQKCNPAVCCNQNGLILKTQYPIRAIDAQIMQAAFGDVGGPDGEVWISYTDINGLRFFNLLGVDIKNGTSYTVYPSALGLFDTNETLCAVPYDDPLSSVPFSYLYGITYNDKFKPNRLTLYLISPAIPNWSGTTLFGELDKWVPMSTQRVLSLILTSDTIVAKLQGAPKEQFNMWYMLKSKVASVTCTMDASGAGILNIDGTSGTETC